MDSLTQIFQFMKMNKRYKKQLAWFLVILFALGSVFACTGLVLAKETSKTEKPKVLLSYPLSERNLSSRIIKTVPPGGEIPDGDYEAEAEFEILSEKKRKIKEVVNLKVVSPEVGKTTNTFRRERQDENRFVFFPKKNSALDITFEPDGVLSIEHVRDGGEIRVEYQDLVESNPATLKMQVTLLDKDTQRKYHLVSEIVEEPKLEKTQTIEMSSAKWIKKNAQYLVKRELGLQLDEDWRYVQDREKTVVQRRTNISLGAVHAMDVIFQPEFANNGIDELECNLIFDFPGQNRRPHIAQCRHLPQLAYEMEEDNLVRLDLKQAIQQNTQKGNDEPVLSEIIFFFKGDMKDVEKERIVEKIILLGNDEESDKNLDKSMVLGKNSYIGQDRLVQKNYAYLIGRELGLPHDSDWRYAQEGTHVVFQKRFHKPFSDVKSVDIKFNPEVIFPGYTGQMPVGCRIRLGFSDTIKRYSEVVECNTLPLEMYGTTEARIFRVPLRDTISRYKSLGKKDIFIEEFVVYWHGEVLEAIRKNYFKRVVFNRGVSNALTQQYVANLKIPISHEKTERGNKVLSLDFDDVLFKNLLRNSEITSITIIASSRDTDYFGGIRLLNSRVVKYGEVKVPKYIERGEEIIERLGGPFLSFLEPGKIEWPWFEDSFKFAKQNMSYLSSKKHHAEIAGLFLDAENVPFSKKPGDFIFNRVTLKSSDYIHRVVRDEKGLILRGAGEGQIEFEWLIHSQIKKGTYFHLDFLLGANKISKVTLIPVSEEGPLGAVEGSPFESLKLDGFPEKIKKLKVLLEVTEGRFKIILKDMTLFKPLPLENNEILSSPTHSRIIEKLVPSEIVLTSGDFNVHDYGLEAAVDLSEKLTNSLTWTTKFNGRIRNVEGIELRYSVSPEMFDRNPCWLQMTWVGSLHSVTRELCPGFSGNSFVEDIFSNGLDFGEQVTAVKWAVKFSEKGGHSRSSLFYMDAKVSMSAFRPYFLELFEPFRLVDTGRSLFEAGLESDKRWDEVARSIENFKVINFNQSDVVRAQERDYKYFENPYVKFGNISLKSKEYIPVQVYERSVKNKLSRPLETAPTLAELYWIYDLIIYVFLAGILWWLLTRPRMAYVLDRCLCFGKRIFGAMSFIKNQSPEIPGIQWKWINRLVGVVVVFPGMWIAGGSIEDSLFGDPMGIGLLILCLSVVWQECFYALKSSVAKDTWNYSFFFGNDESLPRVVHIITLCIFGWGSYHIGQSGLEFLTYNDPVLVTALLYLYLPWLYRSVDISKLKARFWSNRTNLVVAFGVGLYLIGEIFYKSLGPILVYIIFAIGIVTVLIIWEKWFQLYVPTFEKLWVAMGKEIELQKPSRYLVGALMFFVIMVVFRIIRFDLVAQPFGAIGFSLLLVFLFLEIRDQRKRLTHNSK